jgi:hypothetical protein
MRRCGHRVNYPLIRSTPDADGKDLPKREASENPPLEPVTAASKELSTTGIWAHTSNGSGVTLGRMGRPSWIAAMGAPLPPMRLDR